MNQNSNYKNIFLTALISIILTLTAVIYFTDFGRDSDEGNFEFFFKSLLMLCFIFSVPATIIYSIIFGKIDRENFQLYGPFLFFTFIVTLLVLDSLLELGILRGNVRSSSTSLVVIIFVLSLLITKLVARIVFFPKKDNKE
jgi:hypothetical protein